MAKLTNTQRADLLQYALDSLPDNQYRLYQFRLALFEVFESTPISADKLARHLLSRDRTFSEENWAIASALPALLRSSPDDEIKSVQLYLLLEGY